jgi:tRNA threonylcarbamoyl adenosine modification protein YeaZ
VILVIDTSSSQLSIGVAASDGALLREFHAVPSKDGGERAIHDARLVFETSKLLQSSNVSPNEITRIGIIIGPGSFTGLRIGLSFAKGFAFAVNAGIVPLTVHEVLQSSNPSHDGYIITPGYRPDLFYVAETDAIHNIKLVTGAELLKLDQNAMLAHDFFILHPSSIVGDAAFILHPSSFAAVSLASMAQLTANSSDLVGGLELDALEPLYLTEFSVTREPTKSQY